MLKIKDNVDLKELEKFGFVKYDNEFYFDIVPYTVENQSYLCISEKDKQIDTGFVELGDIDTMVDKIYDLIQAGLVEKIEKESK